MNLPLLGLLFGLSVIGVSGQGLVLFNNRVLADENGPLVDGRIYRTYSVSNGQLVFEQPLAAGEGFRAALYGAPGDHLVDWVSSLTMLTNPITGQGAVDFRASAPGYVNVAADEARLVPGADYGQIATFQIRAWAGGFASYEEAVAAGGFEYGYSDPILVQTSSGPDDQFLPRLVGLQPFALAIPEPSIGVFAGIGIAAIVLHRRFRKRRAEPK
jgi:hypothetical protein